MTLNRVLDWDGCNNVRDLGGLNASNGYKTRWGAVVRSDHPAKLTAKGWSQLYTHGIRTIISLRTHGLVEEDYLDTTPRLPDITTIEAGEPTDTLTRNRTPWIRESRRDCQVCGAHSESVTP